MNSKEMDFLVSALTEYNPFMHSDDFMNWFLSRKRIHEFHIDQIPFSKLRNWSFDHSSGNLVHTSGKFFSIEGIWVDTNAGSISQWSQPIINQPEIGVLGILTKKIDGILYCLMQVKMEPGNINLVQLAPTLQATRSNYTCVHKGKIPPYLEYFLDKSDARVLIDTLQSEQGARFLRKRNRNIIIETSKEIPLGEDYCWLTLGQIHKLLQFDNIVNMDARTVLSCIPFVGRELENIKTSALLHVIKAHSHVEEKHIKTDFDEFKTRIVASAFDTTHHLHTSDEIISWFTELKVRYLLKVERIPLKYVKKWRRTDDAIVHENGKYFSVIAVDVQADNREITSWTQPLIKPQNVGIVAYIMKNINGVLHFLVQAKVEPGNFDVVEMAPTVQCITDSYEQDKPEDRQPFLNYILEASKDQIRLSTLQSEEGGRFFQENNRNILIEVGDEFPLEIPDNYLWMTMNQLKKFIKYNNFVNVEGRCLIAALGFI
jgi:dTDP-4-dehydro-6-deoxy-alpha-D-glucopyranose 2,3-dehydratase